MVKPQQPELRRNDLGATSDDATKVRLTAPSAPGVDGPSRGGPIPEDNLPGHHPEHEQDKPSGRDFVAKMHALAQEDAYEAPTTDDEVIDLTQIKADRVHDGPAPHEASAHSGAGDVLATLAGKPFAVVGSVLGAVRNRLPGD
jgi:hypothetical protein